VLDLSLTGMRLAGISPVTTGTEVTTVVGDVCVAGEIARIGRNDFAVRFAHDEAARARIIRHIYSGRYSAQVGYIQPTRVAAAILNRMVR
jgi:hypothetical protein